MSGSALVSLAALEVACDDGLLRHLERLSDAAHSASGDERFVLMRVQEALRLHLALLLERPDALWPVLYAHCAFVDSPRARAFGAQLGLPIDGPAMPCLAQIGTWLDERRQFHARTPWFRALTPTNVWGGPTIAALHRSEQLEVSSFAAGRVVFHEGASTFAWSPAAGTVEPTLLASHAQAARFPSTGGVLLESGVVLLPGWQIEPPVHFSADGSRVAVIAVDDERAAFVLDVKTGATVAGTFSDGAPCALSPSGRWLAAGSADGVTRVDVSDGTTVTLRGPAPRSIAIADDGLLVVASHGVARLIDPARDERSSRTYGVPSWPTPVFSRAGAALLGSWLLDDDGRLTTLELSRAVENARPRGGTRLTQRWLCEADFNGVRRLDLSTGRAVSMSSHAATRQERFTWSHDGLVAARYQRGHSQLVLHTADGERTLETGRQLEAVALDTTGSQLGLLFGDGTVQLQVGGTLLRQFPGARSLAFVHDDRALIVGGASGTSVIGLDGAERWRSPESFSEDDESCARVEWQSELRPASIAEALTLSNASPGLVTTGEAIFPAATKRWVRAPTGSVIASSSVLLSYEPE